MQRPIDPVAEASDLLHDAVPEFRSGVWRLLACDVGRELERRGRRLVFCRVTYRAGPRQPVTADVVIKLCGAGRGGTAAWALRRLEELGFCPPSTDLVPHLYGHAIDRGALVQAEVRGVPWRTILDMDPAALPGASARAAEWLARLHRAPTPAQAPEDAEDDRPISLQRASAELLAAFPRHAALADALERVGSYPPWRGGPVTLSHGDFHPGQVVLDDDRATALDFDAFGLREPAFDVGYCIAQLLAMSHFHRGDFAAGAAGARAFWTAYAPGAAATWKRVRFHVARGLVQVLHYALCGLGGDHPEMLALWPELIARCLVSDGPNESVARVRRR